MKRPLLTALLILPMLAQASVGFRIVHPDGTVEFTDDPLRGGDPIQLVPAPSVPAYRPPARPAPTETTEDREEVRTYQALSILSPQDDQVIWFDGTGVNVNIALQPSLQSGHRVLIKMNGETVAEGHGSSFNIPQVFRGTHTLQAQVVDAVGSVIMRSDTVSFHFRQHSIIRPHQQQP